MLEKAIMRAFNYESECKPEITVVDTKLQIVYPDEVYAIIDNKAVPQDVVIKADITMSEHSISFHVTDVQNTELMYHNITVDTDTLYVQYE